MLNVVILNGGRGAASIISSLLNQQGLHVTSIVNAYDDGKSTGEIRRFFDMLGPSDLRKTQELMLPRDDPDYENNLKLFQFRYSLYSSRSEILNDINKFSNGLSDSIVNIKICDKNVLYGIRYYLKIFIKSLLVIEKVINQQFNFSDCSLMNCIYAGAFIASNRNIEIATLAIDRLFRLRGTVIPNSIENKKLIAIRENGDILYTEAEIVELRSNIRIERIYLLDNHLDQTNFNRLNVNEKKQYLDQHNCFVDASPGVIGSIKQANIIIYAAGTQHSSLYPTYLTSGLAQNIADNSSAFKIFITNIGADFETPSYRASDYINGAYKYLNMSDQREYEMSQLFNLILINNSSNKSDETYVNFDKSNFENINVELFVDNLESIAKPGRHDGDKIVNLILFYYSSFSINNSFILE